jgi:hypothetical protein
MPEPRDYPPFWASQRIRPVTGKRTELLNALMAQVWGEVDSLML